MVSGSYCQWANMNLGLVISSLSSGGAERVMSQLANYWTERGETVTLITIDSCDSDRYALDPRIRRVALGMMSDSRRFAAAILNNYRRIVVLRKALIATGATVVLSFEDRTNVLVLLATAWIPLRRVISERIDPNQHRIGKTWNFLRRLTYPLADALVVQTAVLLPWARAVTLGKRQVEVIANPVRNMDAFVREDAERLQHTIVAVGRLTPQKGFDILLTAFAQIADEFESWKLVILGEGPDRGVLAELAQVLAIADRVALPGWLSEPGEVLMRASLFIMSSRYEGFPNALLEAMACGLSVISTNWAGSEELVTDGFDGLLVPVGSPAQLAAAMRRLISDGDMRDRMGWNARAVCKRYELSSVMQRWDAVLATPCQLLPALRSHS